MAEEEEDWGWAQGPHSLRSRRRVSRHGDRMSGSASKRVQEMPIRPTLAMTLSLVYLQIDAQGTKKSFAR